MTKVISFLKVKKRNNIVDYFKKSKKSWCWLNLYLLEKCHEQSWYFGSYPSSFLTSNNSYLRNIYSCWWLMPLPNFECVCHCQVDAHSHKKARDCLATKHVCTHVLPMWFSWAVVPASIYRENFKNPTTFSFHAHLAGSACSSQNADQRNGINGEVPHTIGD